jgi:hypothetical protein
LKAGYASEPLSEAPVLKSKLVLLHKVHKTH